MVRKMTTESRIADKHQRREICLKNLRECAISVTKGNSITQIDTLLRDQVRQYLLIWFQSVSSNYIVINKI